jgi:hypothetical protein
MCSLRFENNLLTFEGVRFASMSKKTPLSKLSFAFVSLALPLLPRLVGISWCWCCSVRHSISWWRKHLLLLLQCTYVPQNSLSIAKISCCCCCSVRHSHLLDEGSICCCCCCCCSVRPSPLRLVRINCCWCCSVMCVTHLSLMKEAFAVVAAAVYLSHHALHVVRISCCCYCSVRHSPLLYEGSICCCCCGCSVRHSSLLYEGSICCCCCCCSVRPSQCTLWSKNQLLLVLQCTSHLTSPWWRKHLLLFLCISHLYGYIEAAAVGL